MCARHEQGVAHAEHAFDEKGVLSGASGIHSNGSVMGNWSWRPPLIIDIFVWDGLPKELVRATSSPPKNDDGDVKIKC